MANKRELKQMINNVCEQLFAECMAVSLYEVKPDQETLRALLTSILLLRKDYVAAYRIRSQACLKNNTTKCCCKISRSTSMN